MSKQPPKQPPLRPADGAKFHVSIKRRPDGSFRASCRAQIDHPATRIEQTVERVFGSQQEAWNWVQTQAGARGFDAVFVEHELA
jgi:hypothetical protein